MQDSRPDPLVFLGKNSQLMTPMRNVPYLAWYVVAFRPCHRYIALFALEKLDIAALIGV